MVKGSPIRMKAVIYTLSPFEHKVMSGLWKSFSYKVKKKFQKIGSMVFLSSHDESKFQLAKEEAKPKQKIIRNILNNKQGTLKANSGQAVTVGDHHICVNCQEKPEAGYRVWEWHGHMVTAESVEGDEDDGYRS
eukprot:Gb_00152 [translate_table: standard]